MLILLQGVTKSGMSLQELGLSSALAGEMPADGEGRRTTAILRGVFVAVVLVVVWVEVLVIVVVVGGMIIITVIVVTTFVATGRCAT
jgi:hypothetical protein